MSRKIPYFSFLRGEKNTQNTVAVILTEIIRRFLGFAYCIFILLFFIVSIPVYGYRWIVIRLAKILRPDLGDILNGQSALFAVDYFAKSPPRSNLVTSLMFKGHLSTKEVEARVLKYWIIAAEQGKLEYKKFQQYPVKWMGFVFWKNISDPFSVKNHVFPMFHNDTPVTDEQLTTAMEKVLNARIPQNISPWELHVIENYTCSQDPHTRHSVLLINIHHSLCDGLGVTTCLLDGLFQQPVLARELRREIRQRKRTFRQKVLFTASFAFSSLREMSAAFAYNFRDSPFKVPDKRKDWYQVLARSKPISLQQIKNIKNAAGVNFTSVLLTSVSAGVEQSLKSSAQHHRDLSESMPCMSVLPARGFNDRQVMDNHMTGVIFDLPVYDRKTSSNPLGRLTTIDKILEGKKTSVVPVVAQFVSTLMGAHLHAVTKLFSRNAMIPITLSNFASISVPMLVNNGTVQLIDVESINGGFPGDTGVVVLAVSYGGNMRILVTAERALMSSGQVKQFTRDVETEICTLEKILGNPQVGK